GPADAPPEIDLPRGVQKAGEGVHGLACGRCHAVADGVLAAPDVAFVAELGEKFRADLNADSARLLYALHRHEQIVIVREGVFDQSAERRILENLPPGKVCE